ncbi:MAG TPA: nicotinate-nucleotide adenylyltransferase [Lachnospiraceae bacterium]|jgi:nicotinate-nucleotide adenylyltransferase|nr:nicotinate-nucleotide adenylyltransferase [Lachnospiraceae bacterium]
MTGAEKRVGVLGGTFNPIHIGHLVMAESAFDLYQLDRVLILPSGISYMKNIGEIQDAKKRTQMVSLAIQGNKHLELSTIEIDRDGNTYTYETMEYLCERYPDTEFFFIIGADNLFSIEKWNQVEKLFQCCTVLVAGRNKYSEAEVNVQLEYYRIKYGAKVELMDTPYINISSSSIREYLQNGRSIKYMVPPDVEEYIYRNSLYKDEAYE